MKRFTPWIAFVVGLTTGWLAASARIYEIQMLTDARGKELLLRMNHLTGSASFIAFNENNDDPSSSFAMCIPVLDPSGQQFLKIQEAQRRLESIK